MAPGRQDHHRRRLAFLLYLLGREHIPATVGHRSTALAKAAGRESLSLRRGYAQNTALVIVMLSTNSNNSILGFLIYNVAGIPDPILFRR